MSVVFPLFGVTHKEVVVGLASTGSMDYAQ